MAHDSSVRECREPRPEFGGETNEKYSPQKLAMVSCLQRRRWFNSFSPIMSTPLLFASSYCTVTYMYIASVAGAKVQNKHSHYSAELHQPHSGRKMKDFPTSALASSRLPGGWGCWAVIGPKETDDNPLLTVTQPRSHLVKMP